MSSRKRRPVWSFRTLAILVALLSLTSCEVAGPLWGPGYPDVDAGCSGGTGCKGCADKAKVCTKPTVLALARDLDMLEKLIEKYGSIVTKQPDIWGQARLTRHREEFETQMAAELTTFVPSLQGTLSVTDQAYVADATALSAAVTRPPRRAASSTSTVSSGAATTPQQTTQQTTQQTSGQQAQTPPTLQPLPLPDQSDTFAAFSQMSRTPVRQPLNLEFSYAKTGITVEPTIMLDQKKRYLDHLHELRRINEGDDTADSPGYALDLVRIPVSVLPGKCTDIGCGAEVTITMTPYLSDELLPTTFRNLVVNDLLDEIAFPITQFINDPNNRIYFDPDAKKDMDDFTRLVEDIKAKFVPNRLPDPKWYDIPKLKELRWKPSMQRIFSRPVWSWVDELLQAYQDVEPFLERKHKGYKNKSSEEKENIWKNDIPELLRSVSDVSDSPERRQAKRAVPHLTDALAKASQSLATGFIQGVNTSSPGVKSRQSVLPFPRSQFIEVYGLDLVRFIDSETFRAFAGQITSKPCTDSDYLWIHLPDVRGFLQEEAGAAYKFLADPANADLWQFCTPQLVNAIRSHQFQQLAILRQQFECHVQMKSLVLTQRIRPNLTMALAWAIIVDSALLNDQLVQDMREAAAAKGCACGPISEWQPFFLPNPPPEARQAFNEYVRCRWPIHVFALDPVIEEQNLASTFSGRREMQLAMSLAFVSGQLSARNMMRYARRIEYDFATVDLNGTAVGFSHGDNTFGWRFYPRFQTPDIQSNFTVLFQDLFLGGPNRNALLRQRRLEPGIRECVAIVMMPSFVPYATMNVSSNWFKLTNPKCKELNTTYAMVLSQVVKSIQNCATNVGDYDCYRAGDFGHLLAKAKQLETRLPLQSTQVQVPYENTLGGFAMFNTGITDLVPELLGWYGSPSINPQESTTVFLVGKHFSVHQTRVIANGQYVTNQEMLSREVIKVVIPPTKILLGDPCQKFVDVHLATPYGVTQHLLIPVCNPPPDPTAAADAQPAPKGVAWKSATVSLGYSFGGVGIVQPPATGGTPLTDPVNLIILPGDIDTKKYPYVDVTVTFDKKLGTIIFPPFTNAKYDDTQKGYVISGSDFATPVFAAFASKFGPQASHPPCPILTAGTALTFKKTSTTPPAPGTPASTVPSPKIEKKTTNNLIINWIQAPAPGGAPKTGS